jgi:hypothetical protein
MRFQDGSTNWGRWTQMAESDLRHASDVEEVTIGFQRPDGSTGSTPVWIVRSGDGVFVRSMYGERGGWYRRLRANPDVTVTDYAHTHPVRAEPVADEATRQEVTRAYERKYGQSPYVQPLLTDEAIGATLRLEPRA